MADLVTSESRRYLHGIQNTIISDDDTGVALNEVPDGNQLALVDQMEVDGTLTVYGDAYVTSSKNADSLPVVNHNETVGRDVYAAHPASSVSLVPVGSVVATNMQSAVAELDAGKVASNPPLTPSTKTKITYDSKGLVTSGNDATASDIAYVPYGGVVAVNVQDAINAVESHASSAQTAANAAQTAANNAAAAAANAQTAANNAAADAAYADRLARSSHNLIKNGNSGDANPTGYEAVGVATLGYYTISPSGKVRIITGAGPAGQDVYIAKGIPVENPGDQYYFRAYGCRETAAARDGFIGIIFFGPTGAVTGYGYSGKYSSTSDAGAPTLLEVSATAPAGTATVGFCLNSTGPAGEKSAFNLFYACRKVSAGMLEDDAVQSTTHTFKVSNDTASTSTTTGAIVVDGGIGCGDYFTGKYRSSDGTAGLTATMKFYAASSSGGATNVLNTVTIKDGIITSWTQA